MNAPRRRDLPRARGAGSVEGVAALRALASVLAVLGIVGLGVGMRAAEPFALAWVGYVIVGWYLLVRRPANRVGWLLLGVGLCFGGAIGLMPFAGTATSIWIEIVASQIGIAGFAAMALIPIVFPSGFTTDRWGRWMAISLAAIALLTVASEVVGSDPKPSGRASPLAVPWLEGVAQFLQNEGFSSVPILLLGALGGLVVRWRRSSGTERLQYRWFLSALAVVIVSLVALVAVEHMPQWVILLALASFNLLPVSIGVAVLRYRLYEIDRIVSRTITYAAVALIVGLVYAIPVLGIARLLGESNALLVAGSTLAAATVFNPARKAVHRAVEHRFNRSRYDFAHEVDTFSDRLRSELSLEAVVEAVDDVVIRTLQPVRTALWVR